MRMLCWRIQIAGDSIEYLFLEKNVLSSNEISYFIE